MDSQKKTQDGIIAFGGDSITRLGDQEMGFKCGRPVSVAQLDAHPTGDQEVVGSTPAEVGNILSWRLIMKYFLQSFSPFC